MSDDLRLLEAAAGLSYALAQTADAVVDDDGLDRVAEAFAGVIDAKSAYTQRHSTRVAELAVEIGDCLGFSPAGRFPRNGVILSASRRNVTTYGPGGTPLTGSIVQAIDNVKLPGGAPMCG